MPNSLITLFSISICSIGILNSVDVSQATATPLNKSTIKEYIDTNIHCLSSKIQNKQKSKHHKMQHIYVQKK